MEPSSGAMTDPLSSWIPSDSGPVLYLSPHSDDAAFSSAGALHACARRRIPLRIVTCFSVSAHTRTGVGRDASEISRLRKEEDRRFAATLPGAVELRWLDLLDAPLRPQHLGKHPCKETTMTSADADLAAVIEARLSPDIDAARLVLAPLGLGRHIDHLIVRDVGAGLARRGRVRVVFWEDLPYAGRIELDALQREIDAGIASMGLSLRPRLVSDARLVDRKREAVECYASQVTDVHRHGVLGHVRRVSGTGVPAERLWSG